MTPHAPVLEQTPAPHAAPGQLIEVFGLVMAKAGKRWQIVRTHQCVDRVDLQHAKSFDLCLQLLVGDRTARRTPKALGYQGQTARFSK